VPLEFVTKEQLVLIHQEVFLVLVIKVLLEMGHFVKVISSISFVSFVLFF